MQYIKTFAWCFRYEWKLCECQLSNATKQYWVLIEVNKLPKEPWSNLTLEGVIWGKHVYKRGMD